MAQETVTRNLKVGLTFDGFKDGERHEFTYLDNPIEVPKTFAEREADLWQSEAASETEVEGLRLELQKLKADLNQKEIRIGELLGFEQKLKAAEVRIAELSSSLKDAQAAPSVEAEETLEPVVDADADDEPVKEVAPPIEAQTEGTLLPEGFPNSKLLTAAGFDTLEKVGNASSEEIKAIKGIGDSALAEISAALG